MHRYQTYNFRFQLLHRKIVSAYNIAAVCCNNHVQDNMLISNRFTPNTKQTHTYRPVLLNYFKKGSSYKCQNF